MPNLFSKYGRLAILAEQAGKKAFFAVPSAQMAAMQRQFVGDEEGVVRVHSTIDAAIGSCVANRGDVIYALPGYTETLTTAGAIAADVAGISIIGLGNGADRPTLTFSTDTAASMTVSAASVVIKNIIGVAGIDGLTAPFNVTGDNCSLDIEWQDASAAVEAATAVRLDTANGAKLKLVYKGFTAGNAAVRPVAVDDCDNVDIEIDGYGVVSTAWVNLVDVASTNVKVSGTLYTQGITNFTRDVVDTITGSTWSTRVWDASFGGWVSGGSAAALASDDVSAVATSVAAIQTDLGDPSVRANFASLETMIGVPDAANSNLDDLIRTGFNSAAITSNADGSVMERLETIQQHVGATDSVTNILGANDADNGFDSAAVVANVDGSLIERLEDLVVKVTAVDDYVDTEVAAIKVETDQIGTVVNTGGTATVGGILGDFANVTLVSRLNTIDDFLDTEVAAIKTSTDKVDSATLAVSPTAGSLARFVASGGTALGTQLADSKSLVDALGTNGTTVADSAVSVLGAIGANNANNAFDSTAVVANANGSLLERAEWMQTNLIDDAALSFKGAIDGGVSSATVLPIAALSGHGNDYFNTHYFMQVIKNSNLAGGAPESEVRQITDYVSATGTFTVTAFSAVVEDTDEVVILHESLVTLGRDDANNTIATTNVVSNADGSVLERQEYVQAQIGTLVNTGGTATVGGILGDFANITLVSRLNTIDDFLDTEVAAIKTETDQIGTIVNTGGTATIGGILGDFANITLVSRLNTIDDFLDTEIVAIKTETDKIGTLVNTGGTATLGGILGDFANSSAVTRFGNIQAEVNKIDAATLTAAPVAGSLARFVASGGVALGTPLAASKSLVDALGTDGTTLSDNTTSIVGILGVNDADNAFVSSAVVANADGSILERLENVQSDISGAAGIATFPAAAAAANGVSLAQVVRNISDAQLTKSVSKAYAALAGFDTAVAFTVTGDVMVRVFGVVGATGITCTSATTTLQVGTTADPDACLPVTVINNVRFAANAAWVDANPDDDAAAVAASDWVIIGGGADISLTRSVDDLTAGTLTLYCEWKPLSAAATVVAA